MTGYLFFKALMIGSTLFASRPLEDCMHINIGVDVDVEVNIEMEGSGNGSGNVNSTVKDSNNEE